MTWKRRFFFLLLLRIFVSFYNFKCHRASDAARAIVYERSWNSRWSTRFNNSIRRTSFVGAVLTSLMEDASRRCNFIQLQHNSEVAGDRLKPVNRVGGESICSRLFLLRVRTKRSEFSHMKCFNKSQSQLLHVRFLALQSTSSYLFPFPKQSPTIKTSSTKFSRNLTCKLTLEKVEVKYITK